MLGGKRLVVNEPFHGNPQQRCTVLENKKLLIIETPAEVGGYYLD
jgi:hypothetical protein